MLQVRDAMDPMEVIVECVRTLGQKAGDSPQSNAEYILQKSREGPRRWAEYVEHDSKDYGGFWSRIRGWWLGPHSVSDDPTDVSQTFWTFYRAFQMPETTYSLLTEAFTLSTDRLLKESVAAGIPTYM